MAINTKIRLDDKHVEQLHGESLTLSGVTQVATNGLLKYVEHPNFTDATEIVDKQYVDLMVSDATGSTVYNLESPATVTVGGITAGTVLTGKTSNQILKEILVPYLTPTFSSFSNDVSSPVEVGCQISGSKLFSWSFNNGGNVQANTMCVRDVTASVTLSTNISTTSPQSVAITTKTFTSCGDTQVWCGSAKNSRGGQFNSGSYTVTSYLPWFWGKCTCPGPAGSNRPTGTADMITGGTKVVANSSGSLSITFNSGDNDYIWFAVPSSVANKVCWYVNALNNGTIGGGIGAGCNLFPSPEIVNDVKNACWSGQTYKIYISNYQSAVSAVMTIS